MVLRRHDVTLEYDEKENDYILNVDGYSIYLTKEDMNEVKLSVEKGGAHGAEEVANFLKGQDPTLYDTKLTPIATNQNAWDVMEVLQCQFEKPIFTQKPE